MSEASTALRTHLYVQLPPELTGQPSSQYYRLHLRDQTWLKGEVVDAFDYLLAPSTDVTAKLAPRLFDQIRGFTEADWNDVFVIYYNPAQSEPWHLFGLLGYGDRLRVAHTYSLTNPNRGVLQRLLNEWNRHGPVLFLQQDGPNLKSRFFDKDAGVKETA